MRASLMELTLGLRLLRLLLPSAFGVFERGCGSGRPVGDKGWA